MYIIINVIVYYDINKGIISDKLYNVYYLYYIYYLACNMCILFMSSYVCDQSHGFVAVATGSTLRVVPPSLPETWRHTRDWQPPVTHVLSMVSLSSAREYWISYVHTV